jgi:hypothetical protein
MTPDERDLAAQRLRTAFELFEAGCEIMRQNLRRRHPALSPEELERELVAWLQQRPGAEHGDAPGPPGRWPRTRTTISTTIT